MLSLLGLGTFMLGIAKILENMEIAHNVLHAQWDWMKDPEIQSNTWEWDTMSPSDRWMHSHNVVHHTWTNVLEKDLDVGYGIMRVTPMQPWKPAYLLQPVYFILLMLLFEEGVALHEQAIDDHLKGKNTFSDFKPLLKRIGYKIWRQVAKDYIAWPLAAALVAIPISFYVPFSPLAVFGIVAGANAVANLIRNRWRRSTINAVKTRPALPCSAIVMPVTFHSHPHRCPAPESSTLLKSGWPGVPEQPWIFRVTLGFCSIFRRQCCPFRIPIMAAHV